MILKQQDSSRRDIAILEGLLQHPACDTRARIGIEDQIRNLRAGDRGEAEAAYEMDVHFRSPNWVVIHDLRIEYDGVVAQIDHLMINRLLRIWVCESKSISQGVSINDHGEFVTFYNRRPLGMASPIEQNRRHIKILQQVIDAGGIDWPKRLGILLEPQLNSLVLISRGSIQRPKAKVPGLETVIKTDQLRAAVADAVDRGNIFGIAKVVSQATLLDIGQQFVALHRPIARDWQARFGLASDLSAAPQKKTGKLVPIQAVAAVADTPHSPPKPMTLNCCKCSTGITPGVARYCQTNSTRFSGQRLCMECQKGFG